MNVDEVLLRSALGDGQKLHGGQIRTRLGMDHDAALPSQSLRRPRQRRLYGNTVSHMKTSIELPDDLFIAAKQRAAELREPLRALVERGLRAELGRGKGRPAAKPRAVRWVTVAGGLPAGLDIADRAAMHEWLWPAWEILIQPA